MDIETTDITFRWGERVDALERQYKQWRHALFQDVQESFEQQMLYFLYDPVADEDCHTTGSSKGEPGLIIFDVSARCFAGQIPLRHAGSLKFLFGLKCPSPQGGTSLILVTDEFNENYKQNKLHIFRLNLTADGRAVAESCSLLIEPIPIAGDYICSMREDTPELVVTTGPGMHIYRVDCMTRMPAEPIYFGVPMAELSHFYDGFLNNGKIIFLSAFAEGSLDWSRVHVVSLDQASRIITYTCRPDPFLNCFPRPRKECAMDSVTKGIMFAGGECISSEEYGPVTRLRDYWLLKTEGDVFEWQMLPGEMPCDLIEPRLSVNSASGNIYLWGDYDIPIEGHVPQQGTHIRVFKITGVEDPRPNYTPPFVDPIVKDVGFRLDNVHPKNSPGYATIATYPEESHPLVQKSGEDKGRYWSFISPEKSPKTKILERQRHFDVDLEQASVSYPEPQKPLNVANVTVDQPVYNPLIYQEEKKKRECACCSMM